MKRYAAPLFVIFLFLAAMAALFVGHAAETLPPASETLSNLAAAPDPVAQLIAQLAAAHSWVTAALLVLGVLRFAVKPIVAGLHRFAEANGRPKDLELLERMENSPAFRVALFILDWVASIKVRR